MFRHRGSHRPAGGAGAPVLAGGIREVYAVPGAGQKPEEYFRGHCGHVLVNDCASAEEFSVRAKALLQTILQQTTKEV